MENFIKAIRETLLPRERANSIANSIEFFIEKSGISLAALDAAFTILSIERSDAQSDVRVIARRKTLKEVSVLIKKDENYLPTEDCYQLAIGAYAKYIEFLKEYILLVEEEQYYRYKAMLYTAEREYKELYSLINP